MGILSGACLFLVHADSLDMKTKFVGLGSFEAGQVVKGEPMGSDNSTEKIWYQRVYMDLGFNAVVDQRNEFYLVGESMVHYSWTQNKDFLDNDKPQYLFYPDHVEGTHTFGNLDHPYLKIGFGVFPFKYNPDVRNLGEYLYRTGTYPPVMSSQFDFPLARLTGFRLSSQPIDSLHLCAMLTTESRVLPLQDYGVSILGDYTFLNAITVGAGVFWSHLLSVNGNFTTPTVNNQAPIDSANPDTVYYSFQATKLMGRLAIDPKAFFSSHLFGDNDLRLYSEVAILGLKDFPLYYKELWRRIPVMVGFNLPTFRILDVLAVECEWYKWNYPNSYTDYIWNSQVPQPDIVSPNYDPFQNEFKWSFYAKKYVGKNFFFVGQIAYDHMQLESNVFQQGGAYFGDAMHKHGDWAWLLKCAFTI